MHSQVLFPKDYVLVFFLSSTFHFNASLGLCSFQEFFKKDTEPREGETGSAGQQEPAVIVLLPLLLGLGKVSLFHTGCSNG